MKPVSEKKLNERFMRAVEQLVDVLVHMHESNYSVLVECDGHFGEYTGLSIDIEKKEVTLEGDTEPDTWRRVDLKQEKERKQL